MSLWRPSGESSQNKEKFPLLLIFPGFYSKSRNMLIFSILLKNKELTEKISIHLSLYYIFIALFSCQRIEYIVGYDFYKHWSIGAEVLNNAM
jgi:hypothetical protein